MSKLAESRGSAFQLVFLYCERRSMGIYLFSQFTGQARIFTLIVSIGIDYVQTVESTIHI